MGASVRAQRPDELCMYLDVVTRAIRGLAASHYLPEAIDGWRSRITDQSLQELTVNAEGEIRLVAELDGDDRQH
jgi:hypothetical protein